MRYIYISLFALTLSACAGHEFAPEQMAPNPNVYGFMDQTKLNHNTNIGTVTLSDKMPTKSWMHSTVVTDTGFKQTLEQAIQTAGWSSTANPAYTINADLLDQDVPFALFDKQITMAIHYTLMNNTTQNADYQETITMSCPIAFGIGTEQQVINYENAVRCVTSENITQFMRSLNSKI